MTKPIRHREPGAARPDAKGSTFESRGQWFAQLSLGGGKRKAVLLADCRTEGEANERAAFIADLVGQIRRAKKAELIDLGKLVSEAAAAVTEQQLADCREAVREICGDLSLPKGKHSTEFGSSFKTIGEAWTNGSLARMYPDHIKAKRTASDDKYRLAKLYTCLGDLPASKITIDDAERAMRSLPGGLEPGTRRHYAQLIARVLAMACYPLRLIKTSPLPRGWLPKAGPKKGKFCLYPKEEAQLMACRKIPVVRRLLLGFLDREGMRKGEAYELEWSNITSEGEVRLDENKTDSPRAWALDPGVFNALKRWRVLQKATGASQYIFASEGQRVDVSHLADLLRDDLELAGVERAALFKIKSAHRLRLRAHDLRGTFVTIALANGKTETWVMDRTGHTTSGMVHGYRQTARSASELNLGSLAPLDQAIPELADVPAESGGSASTPKRPKAGGAEKAPNIAVVHEEGLEPPRVAPPEPKDVGAGRERRRGAPRSEGWVGW